MAANNASREIREWLRSQGESPSVRGAISRRHMEMYWAAHPAERPEGALRPLPSPDVDVDEYEDLGLIGPESDPELFGDEGADEALGAPREPLTPDAPPAHGSKEWRRGTARKPPGKPVRVTAGIRSDIEGKVSLILDIPGRIWQVRDPYCGSIWVDQVPAMASAWTRYICQSPQLVEWFTSTGGGFIAIFDILAATYPVAAAVMAHHVYHTIEPQAPDAQAPDYGRYAA